MNASEKWFWNLNRHGATDRRRFRFHVSRHHLEIGKPYEPSACPLRHAITDRLKPGWSAKVNTTYIHLFRTDDDGTEIERYEVPLSESGKRFVSDFDHGRVRGPRAVVQDLPEDCAS